MLSLGSNELKLQVRCDLDCQDLVDWLVIEVEQLFNVLKQWIAAVPARALSRTNHINAAHLSNSSSWALIRLSRSHHMIYKMDSYYCSLVFIYISENNNNYSSVWLAYMESESCNCTNQEQILMFLYTQAITWTNVDLTSRGSCGIHLKGMSQELLGIIFWKK